MPYKINDAKRHHFKKHTYRLTNHAQYNQALKNRGRFDLWLSDEILDNWQDNERSHDGTGSTVKYPRHSLIINNALHQYGRNICMVNSNEIFYGYLLSSSWLLKKQDCYTIDSRQQFAEN